MIWHPNASHAERHGVRSPHAQPAPGHKSSAATISAHNLHRREVLALTAGFVSQAALLDAAHADGGDGAARCFLEISVDGNKVGRMVIQMINTSSVGSRRFIDLCVGKEGVGYRRSKFDAIFPGTFIRNVGVQTLSYGEEESLIAGGESTAELERELAASNDRHNSAGIVSLQVRSTQEMLESTKLVAVKGKLREVSEKSGIIPNGTGFAITLGAAPELDRVNLVVGRIVEGMDVLAELAALPVVKDNSGSLFFQAGKVIGDKRANVAEMGFNRPFNKITISASGML